MTDISLGELAADTVDPNGDSSESSESSEDGKATGEFLLEVYERLDEKGLVEPILFGPDSNISQRDAEPVEQGGGEGDDDPDLDAEVIADAGKTVIDTLGDVRVSELVKYAENNPEQVNQLIDQQVKK